MRILSLLIAGILASAMSFGVVFAQTGQLAPVATVTPLTAGVATQIIGTNASRKTIQICNVGTTVVMIWPGPATTTFVSAYELPALSSGTTVCFTPPNGFQPGQGGNSAGNSWGANSFTSTGSITVMEW
jgi:hypothetical protein